MKIALITGASSGMGREFAIQIPKMYQNLDELWVIARRQDRLETLQKDLSIPVRIFPGNMQENEIFERVESALTEEHADIRMLVNAAGFGKMKKAEEIEVSEQCSMVDLNCKALTRMTLLCLPYLSRGSRIVNLASAAAFCPQPGFAVYAASKSYVLSFSRALNEELDNRKISVTAVCPGPVDTEFFDRAGALPSEGKKIFRAKADAVVRQALKDAARRAPVSVYGTAMRASRIFAGILPDGLLVKIMARINHINGKIRKEDDKR